MQDKVSKCTYMTKLLCSSNTYVLWSNPYQYLTSLTDENDKKDKGKGSWAAHCCWFFYCFFSTFFVFFLFSDDVHTKESFVGRDSLQGKNFLNTLLATLSYPGRSSILLLWHTVHKRPLNTRLIYNSNNINQLTDWIKNMPKT